MEKAKRNGTYRCPFCGSERFIGHQIIRADVYVGNDGEFEDNLPGGLEQHVYDSEKPYGPFTCCECNEEFDDLPEIEMVILPRGSFRVIRSQLVKKFKEKGYGYHHETGGFTVIGNGTHAVAVTDSDYNNFYEGKRTFSL